MGYARTLQKTAIRSDLVMDDSSIVEIVEPDTLVRVLSQAVDSETVIWDEIETLSGQHGYIQDLKLQHMNDSEAQNYLDAYYALSVTPDPVPAFRGFAMTTNRAALRSVPGSSEADITEILEAQTLVTVTSQQLDSNGNVWSHIHTFNDLEGFIQDSSLRRLTAQEVNDLLLNQTQTEIEEVPSVINEASAPTQAYGTVLEDHTRIHLSPDARSVILQERPANTVVYVTGQTSDVNGNTWYQVTASGQSGYLQSSHIHILTPEEIAAYLTTPVPSPVNAPEATVIPAETPQNWITQVPIVWTSTETPLYESPTPIPETAQPLITEPPVSTVLPQETSQDLRETVQDEPDRSVLLWILAGAVIAAGCIIAIIVSSVRRRRAAMALIAKRRLEAKRDAEDANWVIQRNTSMAPHTSDSAPDVQNASRPGRHSKPVSNDDDHPET